MGLFTSRIIPKKKAVKKPVKKVVKKVIKHEKAVKHVAKKPEIVKAPKVIVTPRLDEEKAFEMIKTSKIPTVPYIFLKKEGDIALINKIGFPCVMKVVGKEIMHKTEVGGVIKNVNSPEQALEAFNTLMKIKKAEKVVAQRQLSGIEVIIGAKSNEQFGHIVSIGLGGIFVEMLKDVTFRICPITKDDAEKMVKELKGYEVLAGFRGAKAINFEALYDLLAKIGNFAIKNGVKEMDLNPVFCDEKGCLVADVRIVK